MKILAHLLYPGEHNNYHPHVSRPPFLILATFCLIVFTILTNMFYSSRPKLLGFATSIFANEVVDLTNKKRESSGLKALKENPLLSEIAAQKGRHMFEKNYWSHISPEGTVPWYFFQKLNYNYIYAGENLARDFYTSGAVVEAWVTSPSHRDNLLSKNYKEIGVAVVNGTLDNKETTLVVQMFGTSLGDREFLAKKEGSNPENFNVSLASGKEVRILPLSTLGITQKIYLGFSLVLISFFLLDSYILIKRKIRHRERHPFFHMSLLAVIAFLIIYLNKGLIV